MLNDARVAQFLINRVAIDERIRRRDGGVALRTGIVPMIFPIRRERNSRRIVNISHRSEDDPKSKPMSLFPQAMSLFFPFSLFSFFPFFFSLSFLRLFLHEANVSRRRPIGGERDEDEARSTTLFRVCSRDPARRSDSFTV